MSENVKRIFTLNEESKTITVSTEMFEGMLTSLMCGEFTNSDDWVIEQYLMFESHAYNETLDKAQKASHIMNFVHNMYNTHGFMKFTSDIIHVFHHTPAPQPKEEVVAPRRRNPEDIFGA